MKSPGRKSAAQIAIGIAVDGKRPRITAPAYLSKAARSEFIEIVASCDARHFTKSDAPLLASYVQATLMTRATADDPEQFNTFEKAARLQSALAVRLRLTPSARLDPKTVTRREMPEGPFPWENDDE